MTAAKIETGGSYATGWLQGVDLDALEEFRISIGGGCLADLAEMGDEMAAAA